MFRTTTDNSITKTTKKLIKKRSNIGAVMVVVLITFDLVNQEMFAGGFMIHH
jgi:hypothetical protein